jgi:peroxiredoxin (alkyl hydroperoxide reductase subunit C)
LAAPKAEAKDQCVKPAKGIISESKAGAARASGSIASEGGVGVIAQVGKPAPDFEASAFVAGGFKNVKLSDYKGKWVVLCFYPGDFTFV